MKKNKKHIYSEEVVKAYKMNLTEICKSKYYDPNILKTGNELYEFIISKRNAGLREQIDKQNAYIFKTFHEDFMNDRKEVRCTICFKTCHASDSVSDHGYWLMCMPCYQKIREAVKDK